MKKKTTDAVTTSATPSETAAHLRSQEKAPASISLAETLGQIGAKIKLGLPQLPKTTDIGSVVATLSERIATMKNLQADTEKAIGYLYDVEACLRQYSGDHNAVKMIMADTETNTEEMRGYLEDALRLEDKVYRSAVAIAYVKASFSRQFTTYNEAAGMLDDLVEKGLLTEATASDKFSFLIRYKRCVIAPGFGLDEEDQKSFAGMIEKFSRSLMVMEGERRREKTGEMAAKATINLQQALAGNDGLCMIKIPAENYSVGGSTKWRGGGVILVQFKGNILIPIDASGSIEGLITRMMELNIDLERHTLDWQNAPGMGNSFDRVSDAIKRRKGITQDEADECVRKVQAFWSLIKRGTNAFENEEEILAAQLALEEKATIKAAEFFGLNGSNGMPAHGTALLSFDGTFRQDTNSVFAPFLLATRGEDETGDYIEITEVPAHLNGFIGRFVGKRFPTEDGFQKLPKLLSRLIRAIEGQVDMALATSTD